MGQPPVVDWQAVALCEQRCIKDNQSGQLFVETLNEALVPIVAAAQRVSATKLLNEQRLVSEDQRPALTEALSNFAQSMGGESAEDFDNYLKSWRAASESDSNSEAQEKLERAVDEIVSVNSLSDEFGDHYREAIHKHVRDYLSGKLLQDSRLKCIERNTYDPYRPLRRYLFDLLRAPGEENQFVIGGRPSSRVHDLPRMPLLCGDNPLSNTLVSKFLRLTDYQYCVLRQWSLGLFYNEEQEGWAKPNPWRPYDDWVNLTARDLDRGVISNILGGSFCPGAEIGWVMRNPAIWLEPYRIKADPAFYNFGQTPAQANTSAVPDSAFAFYAGDDLSLTNDFETGLQPGDLTKYMSVPWQADFNECSTQPINVTYEMWNLIYPDNGDNTLMEREQKVWETLW
ncbi:MAG: LodA/GoxA family CTQ-dependent oxidase, partial [Blastocatellia bacterium]